MPTLQTKGKKALARDLFLLYVDEAKIAKDLELHPDTVTKWAKDWEEPRRQLALKFVGRRLEAASQKISELVEISLPVIKQGILGLVEADGKLKEDLSTRELKDLTDIVTSLHKLMKLEVGEPTDITEAQISVGPLTIKQIKAAVLKDGYIDVIPLETETKDVTERKP